jgi:hypothetical protein
MQSDHNQAQYCDRVLRLVRRRYLRTASANSAIISGQSSETLEASILGPPDFVPKHTLCETARRSEDRLQDHPAVRDERHEETQHAA